MDNLYYLFIVLAFVAIVLLIEGIYLIWNAYKGPETVRIEKRLRAISAGGRSSTETNLVKQRLLSESPALERLLMQIPRIHSLDRLLIQSGMSLSVAAFIGYTAMALLGGVAIASLLNMAFFMVIVTALLMGIVPYFFVLSAGRKRREKFELQLPEAIDLMARALKAGHAFSGALQMVSEEGPEPIAEEFRTTFDEVNYGISLQDALKSLSVRIPSTDLRYFVIAVLIQRESGGNLAELLENISSLIRARLKLLGTIRVLSAEGRLSAWILTCLPFALALVIYLVNPEFLSVLFTDSAGPVLIGGALTMMVVGIFVMSRIIKIRV